MWESLGNWDREGLECCVQRLMDDLGKTREWTVKTTQEASSRNKDTTGNGTRALAY